jgi:hypothetical protein
MGGLGWGEISMKAIYSDEQFGELEISGTSLEWKAFGIALGHDGAEIPCLKVADPTPYSHSFARIRVSHKMTQKVEFSVAAEESLLIQGDPALLCMLSQTATNFSDFQKGAHIHIEYQGEQHHIGQTSIPAVFMHEAE